MNEEEYVAALRERDANHYAELRSINAEHAENMMRVFQDLLPALQPRPNPDYNPTLRDQFAMAALSGMLADTEFDPDRDRAAQLAYLQADAMLEERAK